MIAAIKASEEPVTEEEAKSAIKTLKKGKVSEPE